MGLDPKQAALQYKQDLEGTGAFIVSPSGEVKFTPERGGGFVPPWVWSQSLHENAPMSWKLPGSDPSSAWHGMYSEGGPFTKRSSWDTEQGTYEGAIDWPTLLGTIGVGSMFAAPAVIGAFGGPAGATTAAASSAAPAAAAAPSVAAPAVAGTTAGTGTAATALSTKALLAKAIPGLADVVTKAAAADVDQSNKSDTLKLGLQDRALAAKKFSTQAPGERFTNAQRAALAKVATPASVKWGGPGSGLRGEVPEFSGGIKSIYAANQDPTMKALSDRVLQDSLESQLRGGPTGGNEDLGMGSASDVGEGSAAGDALGGIGMGLSIFDVLNKTGIFKKRTSTPDPTGISYPADNGGVFEN